MSFLNIKNPQERDAIVKEYLAMVKRLQQNELNEKAKDLVRSEDIERAQEPVVRSTKQSTEAITNELKPIKNEIKILSDRLETRENNRQQRQQPGEEEEEEKDEDESKNQPPNIVQRYYNEVPEEQLDKYFGVVVEGDRYKMGNTYVRVDGTDLVIGRDRYIGTKGFWKLIMTTRPKDFTYNDLIEYRDVVVRTNAMGYPNNITSTSRPTTTVKWTKIFRSFDGLERVASSPNKRVEPSSQRENGDGVVQFLPGDIKGMETKLNYLLGEYRAGNRSSIVTNEIVTILDELLRRKRISRKEYRNINTFLQS